MSFKASTKYDYAVLDSDEERVAGDVDIRTNVLPQPRRQLPWLLVLCFSILASGIVGFQLAKYEYKTETSILRLKGESIVFESNRSFVQPPTDESNALWATLYPGNHGFFDYPDENPVRSTFAGFHQLHCVDTLRRGYHEIYDSRMAHLLNPPQANQNITDASDRKERKMLITKDHYLHCIEFLRQSIMCHSDTTVEAKDAHFKGVVGFGIAHQCRDWRQMVRWVDERNTRRGYVVDVPEPATHHDSGHNH